MPNKNPLLRPFLIALCWVLLSGFLLPAKQIAPPMQYTVKREHLLSLGSPFAPLTTAEKNAPWGREYRIAIHFAQQGDFYRAITAFQRAHLLIEQPAPRRRQIEYQILLSYALSNKFAAAIATFDNSSLASEDSIFPAQSDLLLLLHESYRQLDANHQRAAIWQQIARKDPQQAQAIQLSTLLMHGDSAALSNYRHDHADLEEPLAGYQQQHKSAITAQLLNAALPGAGYFYLGQTQSAITSLALNGCCIAATQHLWQQRHFALAVLMGSIELGWYCGGIYGAAEMAKLYNERLWEETMLPMMQRQRLLPLLFLRHAF